MKPLSELWSLDGRVALVTGSARGLGLAIARRLAEAGAKVVVNDLNVPDVESACARLGDELGAGAVLEPVAGDISDLDSIRSVLERTISRFGRIDIVVNNAGLVPLQPLEEMPLVDWDRLMAVNVRGALLTAQLASAHMIEQRGGGSIVNILSVGAVRPLQPEIIAYCASKAALQMGTQILALDLAKHGIRVNGLLPTVMRTDSTAAIEDLNIPNVPLGRLVDVDEVARGAVFLAGDMAEIVTGITLPVDGGRLIG